MLFRTRKYLAATTLVMSGLGMIALVGCKPAESSADKNAAVEVRGEPINSVKTSPPLTPKTEATNAVVETKPTAPVESKAATAEAKVVATESKVEPKPAPEVKAQPATVVKKDGDYLLVGFDKLASYNFIVPDEDPTTNKVAVAGPDKANDQIPDGVKAFNKKKVSIKGFMLPLKVEGGSVTEFLIMKDQSMCCYGSVPKITEWVSVKTAGKGVKPVMDQAVNVQGTLKVGAMRENGYLVGIYEMEGEGLTESGE